MAEASKQSFCAKARAAVVSVSAVTFAFLGSHVDTILKTLQVVSIVLGGGYFLFKYRQNIALAQKTETLKYVDKFLDKTLSGSILNLDRPFDSIEMKPELAKALQKSIQTKDICPAKEFYYATFLPAYLSKSENRAAFNAKLFQLTAAYEALAVCVNSETCDLESACDYFFDNAVGLISDHCIAFDRYRIQFGSSPMPQTEKFLRTCSRSTSHYVQDLSYCESIRKLAVARLNLTGKPENEQIAGVYAACPFGADANRP